MKNISIAFLLAALQSALCFADLTPSPMPQGTPPQIDPQIQQLIRDSIQASPKLSATSASASPRQTALPQNLPAVLYKAGDPSADNIDNQHAYHDKIKQYLQSQNIKH
jgi:hypothetical protein